MENDQNDKKMTDIAGLCNFAAANYTHNPFLGTRLLSNYSWLTYEEVFIKVEKLANILTAMKSLSDSNFYTLFEHSGKVNYLVGVLSRNSQEYVITMLACHWAQVTVLPFFDKISDQDFNFIMNETRIKTLFVDASGYAGIKNRVPNLVGCKFLKKVICFNEVINSYEDITKYNIECINFSDILKTELSLAENKHFAQENPILLLNYTCNYKSESKGVLISQEALMSTFNDLLGSSHFQLDFEDTYYSMNCLAEVQEYILILMIIYNGAKVGFSRQDISLIFEDFETLRPSIIYSYPRVLIKIFDALQNTISKLDDGKKNLIDKAIKIKTDYYLQKGSLNHHIWDKLLFDKIKNKLGGKIKLIIVGGGSISSHISEFLKICLCCNIVNIYGIAESCGVITLSELSQSGRKYLGNKLKSLNVKISKCNTIGYYCPSANTLDVSTSHGELCVKGRNMFVGYFNNSLPYDEEGWFHTGDYAISVEDESTGITKYQFVDRIENFVKSKLGFWISPMQLEEYYITSELISNISIIQDLDHNLIGVVSLRNIYQNLSENRRKNSSFDSKLEYVRRKSIRSRNKFTQEENGLTDDSSNNKESNTSLNDQLIEDPNSNEQLKQVIFNSFKQVISNYKLKAHEQIDKIFIIDKRKTSEEKILTYKMKIRKDKLKDIYNAFEKNTMSLNNQSI